MNKRIQKKKGYLIRCRGVSVRLRARNGSRLLTLSETAYKTFWSAATPYLRHIIGEYFSNCGDIRIGVDLAVDGSDTTSLVKLSTVDSGHSLVKEEDSQ